MAFLRRACVFPQGEEQVGDEETMGSIAREAQRYLGQGPYKHLEILPGSHLSSGINVKMTAFVRTGWCRVGQDLHTGKTKYEVRDIEEFKTL